jgi:hypothetical protein
MLAEAAGFAFLAAISPTALVVMAVFLASARPRETAIAYVFGALAMTALMAVAVLVIIRVVGLDQPRQHDPRYGLRLGLGVLALLAAAFLAVRRARRRDRGVGNLGTAASLTESMAAGGAGTGGPGQAGAVKGFMSRLVSHPSPRTAFIAGLILFGPSLTFIAAVQVIASEAADTPIIVLGLLIIIVLSALTAWAPLLAYLWAPEATERRLGMLNDWLRARSQLLVILALLIGGIALVANGALGLAQLI